jgi:hypothetical protein
MCWIVPTGASGAWIGRSGHIASFGDAGWTYLIPRDGCIAWIADENIFGVYFESAWHADGWPVAGLRLGNRVVLAQTASAIPAPTGGTTIDGEARAAVSAVLAALRQLGLIAS